MELPKNEDWDATYGPRAYLVGTLGKDGPDGGLKLTSMGLYSEDSPTLPLILGMPFVFMIGYGRDYDEGLKDLNLRIKSADIMLPGFSGMLKDSLGNNDRAWRDAHTLGLSE